MPTALLFVRKIHEKLFLQAGNGGVMQPIMGSRIK